jgi:hypothetical protein
MAAASRSSERQEVAALIASRRRGRKTLACGKAPAGRIGVVKAEAVTRAVRYGKR